MKIEQALFSAGISAFFFDDQQAIKNGAEHDGFSYKGKPLTPGFGAIREAGQSISIQLLLSDGQVAVGDCAAVQYSGAGGRDPLFLAKTYIPLLDAHLRPLLEGMEISTFREMIAPLEDLLVGEKRLHTAIRYGVSQAVLDACACAGHRLKCEVLCDEYKLPVIAEPVPIFGQSGDNRYESVDKMICKLVDVLPHGLINNVEEKLGTDGEKLRKYIRWLRERILTLRPGESYCPELHIDVYGTIGLIFENNIEQIASYLASLEKDAEPFKLAIEGPIDAGGKEQQIDMLLKIREKLKQMGTSVRIVADEWCNTLEDIREFAEAGSCDMIQIKTPDLGGIQNTIEAVLLCKQHGIEAYQGGTCNETDVSARTCVHAALASRPCRMLAKPGMGFDEGYTIVHNEMKRALSILRGRQI